MMRVFSLIPALLIAGSLVLPAIADPPDRAYYDELTKKCMGLGTNMSCCLSSVKRMKEQRAELAVPGKPCPENTRPEMMKCVTSYTWCQPQPH